MEEEKKLAAWRASFVTGLFVVLPAVVTFAVMKWLFGTISSVTDLLLFFVPRTMTHDDGGRGPMFWYWSLVALLFAVLIITNIGRLARNYFGKRLIAWVDRTMMHVPLFNKIYGTIKQVNETFATGSKDSFKTVVRVEFPNPGTYSIGFLTSEQQHEGLLKTKEKVFCVFIPTTPNPTSGFLILVPAEKVVKLDMTVADAVKYIVSLGAIPPGAEKR